jgi:hypothetical protein
MRFLNLFFLLIIRICLFSQEEYAVSLIPDSLRKNATVVIRSHAVTSEIKSRSSMKYSVRQVKTIFKGRGGTYSSSCFYSKSRKVTFIQAILFDANGNELEKVRGNDFEDYSATSRGTFYDENRLKQFRFNIVNYPVTVVFEYEITTSNTAFIYPWKPIYNYGLAIQNSSYTIKYPKELGLIVDEQNFEGFEVNKLEGMEGLTYRINNVKAISKEDYCPELSSFTPQVDFSLNKFHLEGLDGAASNWVELGKWYYDYLLSGNDELSVELINEIRNVTKEDSSLIDKAKTIYNYVQNSCRYVGVQVGIGGLKPFPAARVHELGYGDCKGLTFYTKSLLKSIGIESYFTLIYGGNQIRDINVNSPSLIQGNHIVLCIPDTSSTDSIWLECTSQSNPFNHMGSFTDDRIGVLIAHEGGKVATTKKYTAEENKKVSICKIEVNPEGRTNVELKISSCGTFYKRSHVLEKDNEDRQKYYLRELDQLVDMKIDDKKFLKFDGPAIFQEDIKFSGRKLMVQTGEEFVLPLLAFSSDISVPAKYRERETPFTISRNKSIVDTITFNLPQNLVVLSLPQDVKLETKFGTYRSSATLKDGKLIYNRTYTLNKGRYPKEEYDEFRSFVKQAHAVEKRKIILTQL